MPLGIWRSKWEIHREDMERHREESERRDALYREESQRRDAEYRGELREQRRRSDAIAEETRDLRADYESEIAETRLFNRELLIRMEKTYAGLGSTLQFMGEELLAVRQELHELKNAVNAQTDAILKLVDRFEDPEGRPPV